MKLSISYEKYTAQISYHYVNFYQIILTITENLFVVFK
jgi:hypothetical protein